MKSEYSPGLEVISLMSNKVIQAYRAGCIEINIFVVSEATYALKASLSGSNITAQQILLIDNLHLLVWILC